MAGVSISQPIYTFGKIGNAVDSVHSAIKMSETGKEIAMRDVVYSATDLYWTAKMTDEIVKLAEQDLKNAKTSKTKLTATGRANRHPDATLYHAFYVAMVLRYGGSIVAWF